MFQLLIKVLSKFVHFKNTVTRSSFLSKALSFSLKSKCKNDKNDNAFERNINCVTVFLKWTDFNIDFFSRPQISTCSLASNIQSDNTVICRWPVANWKALFVLLPRSNQVVRYTVTLHCDRINQIKNRPGLVKNFKFLWLAPKHC